jgi:GT2 family glycosyltransferase
MTENTFIIPIIHDSYILEMLASLKANAGHKYQTILIDQRPSGSLEIEADLIIKPTRNLGFAKAMNTGIRLANTEYITYVNDDVVFLDPRWWGGIKETFSRDPTMLAVNPVSPKEPGWGYGKNTPEWGERDESGEFILPKGKGIRAPQDVDYDYLMHDYRKGWISGIAGWCTTLKRDRLDQFFESEKEINPNRLVFDERFYPGGGEDYDVCHRGYGRGFKMVATYSSWVWHHWGKSADYVKRNPIVVDDTRRWNKLNILYREDEGLGWKSPIFGRPHYRVGMVEAVDF